MYRTSCMSFRSNQHHGPIYRLVATELGGERRFAAAVAKRLRSLGALTKGDRRAATAQDMSAFDVDTTYGRKYVGCMPGRGGLLFLEPTQTLYCMPLSRDCLF